MSKNPAWASYNETVRTINEDYEKTVKPLRVHLSVEIAMTEKRINDKIEPLLLEKRTVISGLQEAFAEKITIADKKRRDAVKVANDVKAAEIAAAHEKERAGALSL